MLLRHKSLQKSFIANSTELLTQSQCFLLFSHWVVFPASGWWFASFSRDKFVTPGDEAIMFSGTGSIPGWRGVPRGVYQCCSLASHHCFLVVNTVYRGSGPVSPVPGIGKKGTVLIRVGWILLALGKRESRKVSHCDSSNASDLFWEPKNGQVVSSPSSECKVLLWCLLYPVRPIKVPVICRRSGWVGRDLKVTFQSVEVFLMNMSVTSCSMCCTSSCTWGDIRRRGAQVLTGTEF